MLKIISEPAYILHTYSYRETSLILEVFTQSHGRISLIAKGAKRPQSRIRGLLQIFVPLIISASGRSDLLTLTSVESMSDFNNLNTTNTTIFNIHHSHYNLTGQRLISALYMNELMMNLLHRRDPHTELFTVYQNALMGLAHHSCEQTILRIFEKNLLKYVGYELQLSKEVNTNEPIVAEEKYSFDPEHGPILHSQNHFKDKTYHKNNTQNIIEGKSIIDLRTENFRDKRSLADAKRITRSALQIHLGAKILQTRKLLTFIE